jgi:hypothetical protein
MCKAKIKKKTMMIFETKIKKNFSKHQITCNSIMVEKNSLIPKNQKARTTK